MAALRYRRFLKLCEEWPVDETKRGRDLGAYLRQRVAQAFREGENTQVTGGEEGGHVEAMGGKGGGSAHASAAARLHVREVPILQLAAECDAFCAVSFLVCTV
jgi:hypothetical protein